MPIFSELIKNIIFLTALSRLQWTKQSRREDKVSQSLDDFHTGNIQKGSYCNVTGIIAYLLMYMLQNQQNNF